MTLTQAARLLSPEEIAVQAGQQVPFLRLPERSQLFAEREMRLREKAASHAMRDFLLFMAEVAHCQHELLQSYPVVALPDAAAIDAASRAGKPPLPAALWPRDPAWRGEFGRLVERLVPRLASSPALAAVSALRQADDDWLEQQAERLLGGVMRGLDMAAAPLVAAALQTHWTHLVTATEAARGNDRLAPFGRTDTATLCPCCGSRPTASISRIGAEAGGYRYLHCSLCSAQWHMVRIKCSHCESTKGIHYQSLQALDGEAGSGKSPIEAETCDECGHYLKLVHMERDANVEPVADDLASVTLDLLVSEAGFDRHGVNLMLLFGDPDPDPGGG
ncbi:MAG TPA: formate dehydrogenase accessory protein FdhE [Ideonella sp.]|nr:formate dehydrogenase accessory protein FdhE [Ideonella sp.]